MKESQNPNGLKWSNKEAFQVQEGEEFQDEEGLAFLILMHKVFSHKEES